MLIIIIITDIAGYQEEKVTPFESGINMTWDI